MTDLHPIDDSRRVRRHFVVLTALRWFPTGVVLPVVVLLLSSRGFDLAAIGLIVAVYSIVTAALELPTGGLADVIGRRPVLLASAALTVVGMIGFGLGRELWILLVAQVVLGAARALDSGPLQAWYVDAVHRRDPDADLKPGLAAAGTAELIGLGAGAIAGGGLVAISPFPDDGATVIALSSPFLAAAVFSLVSLVLVAAWVREAPRARRPRLADVLADVPRTLVRSGALVARRGPLRRIVLLGGALGFALAAVELLAPPSFAGLFGGQSAAAGPYSVLVTVAFLGGGAGSALAPLAARLLRGSARAVLAAGMLGAVLLVGVGAPVLAVAVAGYIAFYLVLAVGSPLLDELTHRSVGSAERATMLSVRSMALQLGALGSSLLLGALAASTSMLLAFGVAAGVLAVGSLTMVRMPAATVAQGAPVKAEEAPAAAN